MQGTLSSCCLFSNCLQYARWYRFPGLLIQQSSNVHKQSIYEKLNLPPKPKKPMTPFFKFLSQVRPALAREYPEVKTTELVKIAAQKWRVVDSKLKEKLEQQYKEEAIDYSKIINQYENSLTPEQKSEIKRAYQHNLDVKEIRRTKKKAKDLGRPKKPSSVFIRYITSRVNERPKHQSHKDWILAVSQEWKSISADLKAKLEVERKKEYEKWNMELKAWEENMIKEGNFDVVRTGSLLPPSSKKKTKS